MTSNPLCLPGGASVRLVALGASLPARAGGGQGSNPGGGGYGGGSPSVGIPGGGGGGIGFLPFVGGSPVFLILFLIGSAILRSRGQHVGRGHDATGEGGGAPPPPPPPPPRSAALEAGLAAIAAHDPAFDEPGLLDEVAGIHALVNRSWVQLDPEAGRSVLGDDLFASRKQALEAKARRGEHPHADDLHIGRSDLLAVSVDREAGTERVVVRIHAYARRYDLDGEGQLLSGDLVLRLWSEDWELARSTSEVTRRAAGTSQTCPRCGAPLSLRDDGTCAFCHAQVAAGASGWRVASISPVL